MSDDKSIDLQEFELRLAATIRVLRDRHPGTVVVDTQYTIDMATANALDHVRSALLASMPADVATQTREGVAKPQKTNPKGEIK